MTKLFKSIDKLVVKSLCVIGIAISIFAINLFIPQSGYAATETKQAAPDVIQPFELTKPAASRTEAYDDIAKLNKDPKALIAAENKEERAEEKVYEAEQKAANSVWNK
jgi:hypothetical protein